MSGGLSYRDAGVDIEAGNELVSRIGPIAKSTMRDGVMAGLGGFGALFDLKQTKYTDPVLVSGTDGVGTKLILAIESDQHASVGIDLVAMCANDLVVQGAEPLFFLDYFASGKLDVGVAEDVVSGIAEGCRQAGAALIGGETAEMPGMYAPGHYDLAGFCVGAVERSGVLPQPDVGAGDVVLGLASSGVHSNGFSLVRKVVERTGLNWYDPAPFNSDQTLAGAFLIPTRMYVRSCLAAIDTGGVKALAHITGGGLSENLPRVLPSDTAIKLDAANWPGLDVFKWIKREGDIEEAEMFRAFNTSIGMAIIVQADSVDRVTEALTSAGESVYQIGAVVDRADGPQVIIENGEHQWRA